MITSDVFESYSHSHPTPHANHPVRHRPHDHVRILDRHWTSPPEHYNPLPMFGLRAIMVPNYVVRETLDGVEFVRDGWRPMKDHERLFWIPSAGSEWEPLRLVQTGVDSFRVEIIS